MVDVCFSTRLHFVHDADRSVSDAHHRLHPSCSSGLWPRIALHVTDLRNLRNVRFFHLPFWCCLPALRRTDGSIIREKWWVYSFLDWSQGPSAAVWYIAVALCVVICFFLQYGIHALRDWLASVFVKQQQVDKLRDKEKNDSKLSVMNSDKRYYSQTLVESSIASHITLDASSTDYLAS